MLKSLIFTGLFTVLALGAFTAQAQPVAAQKAAEEKMERCNALANKVQNHLSQVNKKDIVVDNTHIGKANLWALQFAMTGCPANQMEGILTRFAR